MNMQHPTDPGTRRRVRQAEGRRHGHVLTARGRRHPALPGPGTANPVDPPLRRVPVSHAAVFMVTRGWRRRSAPGSSSAASRRASSTPGEEFAVSWIGHRSRDVAAFLDKGPRSGA